MSGYLSRLPLVGSFSNAGAGGPRRLLVIAGGGVLIVAAIFGVTSIQHKEPLVSNAGRLPKIDPTPGGVNSNPQQDKLNLVSNQAAAERALKAGQSYTPVMPSSQRYVSPKVPAEDSQPAPVAAVARAAAATPLRNTVAAPVPSVAPAVTAPAVTTTAPVMRAITVAAPVTPPAAAQSPARTPKEEADFKAALDKMMGGWGGRAPRTDVVLPPDDAAPAESTTQAAGASTSNRRRLAGSEERPADPPSTATQVSTSTNARQRVLVPAGRGIYAHTILAASSDAQSPVVLQADSGPISGDRMIGTFSRERDRLVIRVSKVIHNGQEIGTDGVVVAPGTMEVGVASNVDQNYLSRFALPAAAAFVQGLGQAIAQSNSTSVVGPLGSVGVQNRLNFDQQLGIGAGVAAAQVGSALQQSAPRGPTVTLDVGSSVGVMFLTNVSANP